MWVRRAHRSLLCRFKDEEPNVAAVFCFYLGRRIKTYRERRRRIEKKNKIVVMQDDSFGRLNLFELGESNIVAKDNW